MSSNFSHEWLIGFKIKTRWEKRQSKCYTGDEVNIASVTTALFKPLWIFSPVEETTLYKKEGYETNAKC